MCPQPVHSSSSARPRSRRRKSIDYAQCGLNAQIAREVGAWGSSWWSERAVMYVAGKRCQRRRRCGTRPCAGKRVGGLLRRRGVTETGRNSFGQAIFYTTVDGDSFDSLGYKFRVTTAQLLAYNPALKEEGPIPAGTRVRLMPGEQRVDGARGTFTADAEGVPLTYTTAAGDTERQVSFRFNVSDLRSANRPLTPGAGAWYDFADVPSGELKPGQTISLAANRPINK